MLPNLDADFEPASASAEFWRWNYLQTPLTSPTKYPVDYQTPERLPPSSPSPEGGGFFSGTSSSSMFYATVVLNYSDSVNLSASLNGSLTHNVPDYIRFSCTAIISIILIVGVVGNTLVPIVIAHSKDLRNSTNVFLVNLAVADVLVILLCLPPILVELQQTHSDGWYLGHSMCKIVPFVESSVAHASVLTILAISFERYYAICRPLRAGYICTKKRAWLISLITWLASFMLTSPNLLFTDYYIQYDEDGVAQVPVCEQKADDIWARAFYVTNIVIFFLLPCGILVVLYSSIVRHLIREPPSLNSAKRRQLLPPSKSHKQPPDGTTTLGYPSSLLRFKGTESACGSQGSLTGSTCDDNGRAGSVGASPPGVSSCFRSGSSKAPHGRSNNSSSSVRARRQVIAMLGAVVLSFFLCLLPFRFFILWVIISPTNDPVMELGTDGYFAVLYFCRILVYLNSAINPILYNLMSSKFRRGFLSLFGLKKVTRQGTFTSTSGTTTTTSTTINGTNSSSFNHKYLRNSTNYSDRENRLQRHSCRSSNITNASEYTLPPSLNGTLV